MSPRLAARVPSIGLSVQENGRELTACAGKPKPLGANLADERAGSGKAEGGEAVPTRSAGDGNYYWRRPVLRCLALLKAAKSSLGKPRGSVRSSRRLEFRPKTEYR